MSDIFSTAILFTTLTAILVAGGWIIGGVFGMTFALVIALMMNFLSYWYSDRIVLRIYNAYPTKNYLLENMAKKLSKEAKIPEPRLYMVDTDVPNAFATGRSPKKSAVVLTKGLLQLDDKEIEAVMAHEIGHIRNRDTLVSMMAATIAGAISYLAQIGYWSLFTGGSRREQANLMGLFFIIVFAPIAALIIRLAITRSREYKADYAGALFSKNPQNLASALRKISEIAEKKPLVGSTATSHLWIVNPFHKDWFSNLFSTHPPIKERMKRLEEMTKLHI